MPGKVGEFKEVKRRRSLGTEDFTRAAFAGGTTLRTTDGHPVIVEEFLCRAKTDTIKRSQLDDGVGSLV